MVNNYHYYRGGAETVMLEEAKALERSGHEVATFSTTHPDNTHSVLEGFFPAVPLFSDLSLVAKLRHIPRLVSNRRVKEAFVDALNAFRPTVVHFHNVYGRLTPVVIEAARESGVSCVMTAHDYKLICSSYLRLDEGRPCSACSYGNYWPAFGRRCHKSNRLYTILYAVESTLNAWWKRYEGVSTVICPSRFMLESLASKGVRARRLRLLPNFVPDGPSTDSRPGEYLLYAGRLSAEKGVATLLRAMAAVNAPLLLAGDGPEAPNLKRLASALKLDSRVQFLGRCAQQRVHDLIGGALFTIVPSECFENSPMAVLESFGHGKPVAGADIGGIPELVIPGTTGALFPPGNVAAMRSVIIDLLASPARLALMGQTAREMVMSRFSTDAHIRALATIYEEALA